MGKLRILMGILAVHITTANVRDGPENQAPLGYLGHPGQFGFVGIQNDVTVEAVRAMTFNPPSRIIPLQWRGGLGRLNLI